MQVITVRSWSQAFNLAINVITIGVAIYFVWVVRGSARRTSELAVPTEPISLEGTALKGNVNAPVAIIEYSDFQCPFCGQFARNTLPVLETRFMNKGMLVFAFKHRPLESVHQAALGAAAAAVCAGQQGAFWPMHNLLFNDATHITPVGIAAHVRELHLDQNAFNRCDEAPETIADIRQSNKSADDIGLGGTPAFLIGRTIPGRAMKVTRVIEGAKPATDFVSAIDSLLRTARDTRR